MAEEVGRAHQARDIEVDDGNGGHRLPNSLHKIILELGEAVPNLAERNVVSFSEERT